VGRNGEDFVERSEPQEEESMASLGVALLLAAFHLVHCLAQDAAQ